MDRFRQHQVSPCLRTGLAAAVRPQTSDSKDRKVSPREPTRKWWALGARCSAVEGGGRAECGLTWASQRFHPAGLCLSLCQAEGRDAEKSGEVWPASPRGRAEALGQREPQTPSASLGRAPCNTPCRQAIHTAQGPSQPSTKASPRPEIRAKALALSHSSMGMWSWASVGTWPSSASGSSDSWGGKESRSPGNGSPRWCLLGPRGPSAGLW